MECWLSNDPSVQAAVRREVRAIISVGNEWMSECIDAEEVPAVLSEQRYFIGRGSSALPAES